MAELIEAILNLSRLTRKEMKIRPLSLSTIAEDTMNRLLKQQPDRQVDVKIPEELPIQGDPQLITVVVDNLLSNAWKFTQKKARAHIEFGSMPKKGTAVYFVKDNGVGFNMKYVDKLFTPFQRLHSDKEFPGIGIGLATVKRIIGKHGGKIWAEGKPGEGATFYFTLQP
jgi:light-regulated signal transduction histidine kinase (bacteriophytochrome)